MQWKNWDIQKSKQKKKRRGKKDQENYKLIISFDHNHKTTKS